MDVHLVDLCINEVACEIRNLHTPNSESIHCRTALIFPFPISGCVWFSCIQIEGNQKNHQKPVSATNPVRGSTDNTNITVDNRRQLRLFWRHWLLSFHRRTKVVLAAKRRNQHHIAKRSMVFRRTCSTSRSIFRHISWRTLNARKKDDSTTSNSKRMRNKRNKTTLSMRCCLTNTRKSKPKLNHKWHIPPLPPPTSRLQV